MAGRPAHPRTEESLLPARLERLRAVAAHRMHGLRVVLESLYDDGNRAAIYRTAEGHGVLQIELVTHIGTKAKARAVSRGTEKWLDVREHESADACVDRLHAEGFRVAVADLRSSGPLAALDFSRPIALAFGNEHAGISERLRDRADAAFCLPMRGFVESFNVSVAAAIALSQARTLRERAIGAESDLSREEQAALVADWIARS